MLGILVKYSSLIEKRKIAIFVFFAIGASLLETVSIAGFIAVLNFLLQDQNNINNSFFEYMGLDLNLSIKHLIIFFVCAIVFKSFFLTIFSIWRNNFIFKFNTKYTTKLFNSYLSEDYDFHLNKNTSELVRNTFSETRKFSSSLDICLKFLSEIFIILLIICFLIFFNFKFTLIALSIASLIFLIFTTPIKSKLFQLGKEKLFFTKKMINVLREGFTFIKDVKIYKLNNFFKNNLEHKVSGMNKPEITSTILTEIPKNFIEIVLLIIILILAIISMSLQLDVTNENLLLLTITYFTATIKLIPSILRTTNCFNIISNQKASINLIMTQITKNENINFLQRKPIILKEKNTLKFINLNFNYPNTKKIIKDLNFEIKTGEICLITGHSGSGKTTLINLIAKLLKPSGGLIEINGINLSSSSDEWHEHVAYVSQNSFLLDESIKKNIVLSENDKNFDETKFDKSIKNSLSNFIFELKEKENFIVGENGSNLSGGQMQRILLARALYKQSEILILDEFTSALDKENEMLIIDKLESLKKDKIIFIASHNNLFKKISDFNINFENSNGEISVSKNND